MCNECILICEDLTETLKQNRAGDLEKLKKKIERRILRKILGPKHKNLEYKLRANQELYLKTEKWTRVMRKRRLWFNGHIHRINHNRLTKQI